MSRYAEVSQKLIDEFWEALNHEFQMALKAPEANHSDLLAPELRRANLKRFPYNFLYLVEPDRIRIQIVRHNSGRPGYGTRRKK